MKTKILMSAAAMALLASCGEQLDFLGSGEQKDVPEPQQADSPQTLGDQAEPDAPPPSTPFEALMAGEMIKINLDVCDPADANSWEGDADPAGVLVCGTSYEVRYDKDTNMIIASGLEESAATEPTTRSNGREWAGATNQFNIWGARHYMIPNGDILDRNNELVGHVVD